MSDTNDDSDESEDAESLDDFFDEVLDDTDASGGTFMNPMAGMMMGGTVNTEPSEEVEIATRMMMAGRAMNDFVDYAETHDLQLDELDRETMNNLDYEERVVLFGFMSMNVGFQRLGDLYDDDDDDDNPFKVSDGDDPVY